MPRGRPKTKKDWIEAVQEEVEGQERSLVPLSNVISPHSTATLDPISDEQVRWLTYRLQSTGDKEATRRFNEANQDRQITMEEVAEWWNQDQFQSLAAGVLQTPRLTGFRNLADMLFPAALRSLMSLIQSQNAWAQKNGIELLFRLNGMLIDKKQVEAPDIVEAMNKALGELKHTPIIRVHQRTNEVVEGEYKELKEGQSE